ncbi:DUF2071 domain-containing protein [Luteimonas gilva]|uniref:DUF2071 domain-containing protein n=1 Tax=Luteimonas gilva TaxID=2572684 RepID=A0A4U5JX23_9GAMM|nr:DUF2071 domain-containing protein [Luteimonas gilva]TKR31059.1 DUF2071 domain-containing protein [Luteimonas gilva]
MRTLRFRDHLIPRPQPHGIDVVCKLQHFAIVTYAFDPSKLDGSMPPRFEPDLVEIDGRPQALLSVVPFIDVDFTSACRPFPRFTMGQTNYRIYILDRDTGERAVWFLGTTLDSWTRVVPHTLWNLPWYGGRVEFDCDADASTGAYRRYFMRTRARWAPAQVELTQGGTPPLSLPGFPDEETGLVYLTHPLAGFYHRRDGQLGTYRVWHDRLEMAPATLLNADFGLLSRQGWVDREAQQKPHSVLVQPINEFTIYLPPKIL